MLDKKLVIVGNWKMNKTPGEAKQFFAKFNKLYNQNKNKIGPNTNFGFSVPTVDLEIANEAKIKKQNIVAAQDVHHKEEGAFTGDLSALMLKAVGTNAVVIGHSERRQYHFETDDLINQKIKQALKHYLLPIVCLGESLTERENNTWKAILTKQLKGALNSLKANQVATLIVAYEPIWAIGTGKTASASQAQEACQFVRQEIAKLFNNETAKNVTIQYGGSVKPENAHEILSQPDIDGALVGGASLDPASFMALLTC